MAETNLELKALLEKPSTVRTLKTLLDRQRKSLEDGKTKPQNLRNASEIEMPPKQAILIEEPFDLTGGHDNAGQKNAAHMTVKLKTPSQHE